MAVAGNEKESCAVRILIVDDDPGIRAMLIAALGDRGWHAEEAADGLQALARLQHRVFDVLITDLQMPRMDGFALLREVARMGRPLPVVVHTAYFDTAMEAFLRRAGAFCVLTKGGPLEDLVRSVEDACLACKHPPACCA